MWILLLFTLNAFPWTEALNSNSQVYGCSLKFSLPWHWGSCVPGYLPEANFAFHLHLICPLGIDFCGCVLWSTDKVLFIPCVHLIVPAPFIKKTLKPWLVWLSGLALAWESKGCWFDSQSGHVPELRARSPVGGTWETTTHWCISPLLSSSLPL